MAIEAAKLIRGRDVACVAGCHLAYISQNASLAYQDARGED